MRRPFWLIGSILLIVGGAWLVWLWRESPATASVGRQVFVRPEEITPGLIENVSLQVNGVDWWSKTPTVQCGSTAEIVTRWIGDEFDHRDALILIIAPRPASDPNFGLMDGRADTMVSPQKLRPETERWKVRLAPGDYVVRIYLQKWTRDEQDELTDIETDLIAERPLVVAAADQEKPPTIIPGDGSKGTHSAFVEKFGSNDSRREAP